MADYNVTSASTQRFSLIGGSGALGELTYQKWSSSEATISLADTAPFHIKPEGFGGTASALTQAGVRRLHCTTSWNGDTIIHSALHDQPQGFVLKHKGLLKTSYTLTDHQKQELLVARPTCEWNKLSYDYAITTTDAFEALPFKELLLLLTVHCINCHLEMLSAVALLAAG